MNYISNLCFHFCEAIKFATCRKLFRNIKGFYRRDLQAVTWQQADVTEYEAYHSWDVTHTRLDSEYETARLLG